jgi:alkylation response protein AidB-like acyl-CoA dehydrogenase
MQFAYTEDQIALTDAARQMLVETCAPADLRRLLKDNQAHDEARWNAIKNMGLLAMLAPESAGGLGLSLPDFVGVAEAAGYVALPEPLVELAGLTIPLLAALPDDRGMLQAALDGSHVALGCPVNRFVADADSAIALVLANGAELHVVARDDVAIVRQESVDPFRRLFCVDWTPTTKTRVGEGWRDTAQRGAILAAAQMLGAAQRCIDLAVEYAKTRTQFGKPIGSYQAVKHLLATAQVKLEFARPVVSAAATEAEAGGLAAYARASHAKIAAGDAADLAARTAVQVFGAMGMTWEVDVHFFLKRALALRGSWGAAAEHRKAVIERITSLRTGPDATFASELDHHG